MSNSVKKEEQQKKIEIPTSDHVSADTSQKIEIVERTVDMSVKDVSESVVPIISDAIEGMSVSFQKGAKKIPRKVKFSQNPPTPNEQSQSQSAPSPASSSLSTSQNIENAVVATTTDSLDEESIDLFNVAMPEMPVLSSFGVMYTTLDNWVTRETKLLLKGEVVKEPQVSVSESVSEENSEKNEEEREISPPIVNPSPNILRKQALTSMMGLHLPSLCSKLSINAPHLHHSLSQLIDTFVFPSAVPSFTTHQWHTVLLVLITALSVHDSALSKHLHRNNHKLLKAALQHYRIDPDAFKTFVEIFVDYKTK